MHVATPKNAVRPEVAALLPDWLKSLPVDRRGYPVPWFVAWIDGEPDFRIVDSAKLKRAIDHGRCWICGERLGSFQAFVIGPMCAVNRTSSEPPSHEVCATFAARACPFLSRPHMRRREAGLPEGYREPAGHMIPRNPGVSLVWITKERYRVYADGLIKIGKPLSVTAWAEGRLATAEELVASIESGLPELARAAESESKDAVLALNRAIAVAYRVLNLPRPPTVPA